MANKIKGKTYVWLMGGLGNQLFQLNKAYEFKRSGYDVVLIDNLIDPKSLITSKILGWKIHDNILCKIYTHDIPIKRSKYLLPAVIAKLPFLNNYSKFSKQSYIVDNATHLFGYFQDSIILNLKPERFKSSAMITKDTVMHLRLTDNNNMEYSKLYYARVLSTIKKQEIKIVTDDELAASEIIKTNTNFKCEIITKNAISDFQALSRSETLICAPSTYSFWAALANEKAHKIYVPQIFKNFLKSSPKNWIYI